LAERETTGGFAADSHCPHCHEQFAIPGPSKTVAIASLIIAMGILLLVGVRSALGLAVGSVLLWIPISFLWNISEMSRNGVVLRQWKPLLRRTFSDWLADRDKIRAPVFKDDKTQK
jgi:hypothetical protein